LDEINFILIKHHLLN